jgi:hypothetical protein
VIRTSDGSIFAAIRFLECNPDIVQSSAAESVLTVEPFRGRFRIAEEGRDDTEVLGLTAVLDHFSSFLFRLDAKSYAGVLHAASLRRGRRRVLLVGHQAAGKTTLALRLIQTGYDFEGDEHVFLENDGVIARPRACRVKEASLALLPEAAAVITASPVLVDDCGRKIFNVDPRSLGGSWRIEKGRADCVIVLQPNHGGYSSIRPLPPLALAQALMAEYGLLEASRGAQIGVIAQLARISRGYDLSLGDHDTAVRCIESAVRYGEPS